MHGKLGVAGDEPRWQTRRGGRHVWQTVKPAAAFTVKMGMGMPRSLGGCREMAHALFVQYLVRQSSLHQPLEHAVNGDPVNCLLFLKPTLNFDMTQRLFTAQQDRQHGDAHGRGSACSTVPHENGRAAFCFAESHSTFPHIISAVYTMMQLSCIIGGDRDISFLWVQ